MLGLNTVSYIDDILWLFVVADEMLLHDKKGMKRLVSVDKTSDKKEILNHYTMLLIIND